MSDLIKHYFLANIPTIGVVYVPTSRDYGRFSAPEPIIPALKYVQANLNTEMQMSFYKTVFSGAGKAGALLVAGTTAFTLAPAPCCKAAVAYACYGLAGTAGVSSLTEAINVFARWSRRKKLERAYTDLNNPTIVASDVMNQDFYQSFLDFMKTEGLQQMVLEIAIADKDKCKKHESVRKDLAIAYRTLEDRARLISNNSFNNDIQNAWSLVGDSFRFVAKGYEKRFFNSRPNSLILEAHKAYREHLVLEDKIRRGI